VYVVAVVSVKCSTGTAEEAKDFGVAAVMGKMNEVDSMGHAHCPKVAVVEDSAEGLENLDPDFLDE
jgi:hypothetical protein